MAEDQPDLLSAILLVLTEEGYQVETARDGLEAAAIAPQFQPDLVILDMRMPKMSVSDSCAAIRKISVVPIIMFTSSNEASDVRYAIV